MNKTKAENGYSKLKQTSIYIYANQLATSNDLVLQSHRVGQKNWTIFECW